MSKLRERITMESETESITPEREREHTVDAEDRLLPATPDEIERNRLQLTEIQKYTVDAATGLMRLPVKQVTTAENSEQYVIEPHHPVLDAQELRQFVPKPVHWSPDAELVQILEWYCGGGTDPFALQTESVYMRHDEQEDEWNIVKPPDFTYPMRTEVARTWRSVKRSVLKRRPSGTAKAMYAFMLAGVVLGAWVGTTAPSILGGMTVMASAIVGQVAATIFGLVVLNP